MHCRRKSLVILSAKVESRRYKMAVAVLPQVKVEWPRVRTLAPSMAFTKEQCYWPESIELEKEFDAKWVVVNIGDDGEVFLGFSYAGKDYVFQDKDSGLTHWPLKKNYQMTFTITTTMKEFFGWVGEDIPTASKTVAITFMTGYWESDHYYMMDSWEMRTLVQVAGGFKIPTWAIVGSVGVVLVGTVLVVATRRKK
jgi:hypothetical protein